MNASEIIAVANSWIGVRWHHQGRSRAGVDCIGLLVCVARDLGFCVEDQTDYSRQPDGRRLAQALGRYLEPARAPEPGAVLLMRFEQNPQHVALMVDNGEIVHAYAHMRKVVRHRLDDVWARRIVGCYRFPGVTL